MSELTGEINKNEEKIQTVDKEWSQLTEQIDKNQESDLSTEAPLQYLLLSKLADNLELTEIINENLEGDEIDGFKERIKELVEKIFEELKGNIDQKGSKEGPFVKAIMRIFSILFKANISPVKEIIKKKQSVSLVLKLWPEPNLLLEDSSVDSSKKQTKTKITRQRNRNLSEMTVCAQLTENNFVL